MFLNVFVIMCHIWMYKINIYIINKYRNICWHTISKEKCATGFERTSLSSLGAKRLTTTKTEGLPYWSAFFFPGSRTFCIWWKNCPFKTGCTVFCYLWCVSRGIFIFVHTSITNFFIYYFLYFVNNLCVKQK